MAALRKTERYVGMDGKAPSFPTCEEQAKGADTNTVRAARQGGLRSAELLRRPIPQPSYSKGKTTLGWRMGMNKKRQVMEMHLALMGDLVSPGRIWAPPGVIPSRRGCLPPRAPAPCR